LPFQPSAIAFQYFKGFSWDKGNCANLKAVR
jgi:hypothetical protein